MQIHCGCEKHSAPTCTMSLRFSAASNGSIYIYINSFSTQAHPDIPNAFGNLFMEMALGGWEISGSVFACVLLLCSGPCKLAETQQRICFPPAGMAGVVSVRVGLSPGALGRQNELCRHGGPRHLNHCS